MNNMNGPEKITSTSNAENTVNTDNAASGKESDGLDIFWTTNKKSDETIASDNKPEDKTPATPAQPEQITEDTETKESEEAPEEKITLDDMLREAERRGLNWGEKSEAKNTRKGRISAIVSWLKQKAAHLVTQNNEKKKEAAADSDTLKPTTWHFGDPIHQWDEESKTFVNVVQRAKNVESAQNAQKTDNDKPKDETPAVPAQQEQTPAPELASNPEKPNEEPETKEVKEADEDKETKDTKDAKDTEVAKTDRTSEKEKISEEEYRKQGDDLIKLATEKLGRDELPMIIEYVKEVENSKNYNYESDYRIKIVKEDLERKDIKLLKNDIATFLDMTRRK